ncbi:MAG: hypothetical protein IJ236_03450 [Oscillospiraceae bacterium]|nr:hypothetical protein [Oscillospiraceae bacterium]
MAANVSVSEGQEEQLLDIATSGKNTEAVGILGKIRQLFRWSLQQTDTTSSLQTNTLSSWYAMGVQDASYWSLRQYTQQLQQKQPEGEEWDELEKSIIAKLADEVRVGIRAERAEVVIEKYIHNIMEKAMK